MLPVEKQTKTAFASILSHLPHDHAAWKVLGPTPPPSGTDGRAWGTHAFPCGAVTNKTVPPRAMSNVLDLDIDEYSPDTRPVLYDPDFAKAQVMKMNAHQHTQATVQAREVLAASSLLPSALPQKYPPPEWKGCKQSFYCVRNCGSDGNHLKEDGSPGGRGQCRLRPPPDWYCVPVGQPSFDDAKRVKKRKREGSPSYAHKDQYWGDTSHAQQAAQQAATQEAQAAQQAAAQQAQQAAAQQAQQAQQAATQPSEMETLRTAIQRLQEENARLSQEVNNLKEWKARMFAAFMPSPP